VLDEQELIVDLIPPALFDEGPLQVERVRVRDAPEPADD
jgi:hypothetical protein